MTRSGPKYPAGVTARRSTVSDRGRRGRLGGSGGARGRGPDLEDLRPGAAARPRLLRGAVVAPGDPAERAAGAGMGQGRRAEQRAAPVVRPRPGEVGGVPASVRAGSG